MPWNAFFSGVVARVDKWNGALFFRGQSFVDIEAAEYRRLKYWYEWHEVIRKAEMPSEK